MATNHIQYTPISANLGDPVGMMSNATKTFSEIGNVFSKMRESMLNEAKFEESKRQFELGLQENALNRAQDWNKALLGQQNAREAIQSQKDLAGLKAQYEKEKQEREWSHQTSEREKQAKAMSGIFEMLSGRPFREMENKKKEEIKNGPSKDYIKEQSTFAQRNKDLLDQVNTLQNQNNFIKSYLDFRKDLEATNKEISKYNPLNGRISGYNRLNDFGVVPINDIPKKFMDNLKNNIGTKYNFLNGRTLDNVKQDIQTNLGTLDKLSEQLKKDPNNADVVNQMTSVQQNVDNLKNELALLNVMKDIKSGKLDYKTPEDIGKVVDNVANMYGVGNMSNDELNAQLQKNTAAFNNLNNQIAGLQEESTDRYAKGIAEINRKYDPILDKLNPGQDAYSQGLMFSQLMADKGYPVDVSKTLWGQALLKGQDAINKKAKYDLSVQSHELQEEKYKHQKTKENRDYYAKQVKEDFMTRILNHAKKVTGNKSLTQRNEAHTKAINDLGERFESIMKSLSVRSNRDVIARKMYENVATRGYGWLPTGVITDNPSSIGLARIGFGPGGTFTVDDAKAHLPILESIAKKYHSIAAIKASKEYLILPSELRDTLDDLFRTIPEKTSTSSKSSKSSKTSK